MQPECLFWAMLWVLAAMTPLPAAESEAAEKAEHTIVADSAIQAQMSRTVRAYSKVTPESPERMGEAYRELQKLLKLDTDDRIRLTRQSIYLQVQAHKEQNFDKLMGATSFFRHANIGRHEIVRAIVPYVGTTNEPLAEYIDQTLGHIEYVDETRERDFTIYRGVLTTETGTPRLPLIERMYRKAPGKALLACLSLDEESERKKRPPTALYSVGKWPHETLKRIRLAEHVVADVLWKQKWKFIPPDKTTPEAVAELEKLSKHKAWWARLYVAAILRQEPEFRSPELIERLRDDSHPLVGKVIGQMSEPHEH